MTDEAPGFCFSKAGPFRGIDLDRRKDTPPPEQHGPAPDTGRDSATSGQTLGSLPSARQSWSVRSNLPFISNQNPIASTSSGYGVSSRTPNPILAAPTSTHPSSLLTQQTIPFQSLQTSDGNKLIHQRAPNIETTPIPIDPSSLSDTTPQTVYQPARVSKTGGLFAKTVVDTGDMGMDIEQPLPTTPRGNRVTSSRRMSIEPISLPVENRSATVQIPQPHPDNPITSIEQTGQDRVMEEDQRPLPMGRIDTPVTERIDVSVDDPKDMLPAATLYSHHSLDARLKELAQEGARLTAKTTQPTPVANNNPSAKTSCNTSAEKASLPSVVPYRTKLKVDVSVLARLAPRRSKPISPTIEKVDEMLVIPSGIPVSFEASAFPALTSPELEDITDRLIVTQPQSIPSSPPNHSTGVFPLNTISSPLVSSPFIGSARPGRRRYQIGIPFSQNVQPDQQERFSDTASSRHGPRLNGAEETDAAWALVFKAKEREKELKRLSRWHETAVLQVNNLKSELSGAQRALQTKKVLLARVQDKLQEKDRHATAVQTKLRNEIEKYKKMHDQVFQNSTSSRLRQETELEGLLQTELQQRQQLKELQERLEEAQMEAASSRENAMAYNLSKIEAESRTNDALRLREDLEASKFQITKLEQDLKRAENRIEQTGKEMDAMQETSNQLRNTISQYDSSLTDLKKELDGMGSLRTSLQLMEKEKQALESTCEMYEVQLGKMERERDGLRARCEVLVVDNTALATELGLVKANLHDVQATCAEKELTRTAELQEELEEARNAASENDHKYKTVLSQLQNQEKELSQAKDAQAIAEGELSALKSVKLHVEQELQRSLEFPKEIKHEISKISESFEKAAKDLKTTTEQEVLAREQNRAAQISSLKTEIAGLKAKIVQANHDRDVAQASVSLQESFLKEIKQVKQSIESARSSDRVDAERIESGITAMIDLQNRLNQCQDAEKMKAQELQQSNNIIQDLRRQIESQEQHSNQVLQRYWADQLTDIENSLCKQAVSALSERFNGKIASEEAAHRVISEEKQALIVGLRKRNQELEAELRKSRELLVKATPKTGRNLVDSNFDNSSQTGTDDNRCTNSLDANVLSQDGEAGEEIEQDDLYGQSHSQGSQPAPISQYVRQPISGPKEARRSAGDRLAVEAMGTTGSVKKVTFSTPLGPDDRDHMKKGGNRTLQRSLGDSPQSGHTMYHDIHAASLSAEELTQYESFPPSQSQARSASQINFGAIARTSGTSSPLPDAPDYPISQDPIEDVDSEEELLIATRRGAAEKITKVSQAIPRQSVTERGALSQKFTIPSLSAAAHTRKRHAEVLEEETPPQAQHQREESVPASQNPYIKPITKKGNAAVYGSKKVKTRSSGR